MNTERTLANPHPGKLQWSTHKPKVSLAARNGEESKLHWSRKSCGKAPCRPGAERQQRSRTPKSQEVLRRFFASQASGIGKGRRCRCISPGWDKWGGGPIPLWTTWPKNQWPDTECCPSMPAHAGCTRHGTSDHKHQSWKGRPPSVHLHLQIGEVS